MDEYGAFENFDDLVEESTYDEAPAEEVVSRPMENLVLRPRFPDIAGDLQGMSLESSIPQGSVESEALLETASVESHTRESGANRKSKFKERGQRMRAERLAKKQEKQLARVLGDVDEPKIVNDDRNGARIVVLQGLIKDTVGTSGDSRVLIGLELRQEELDVRESYTQRQLDSVSADEMLSKISRQKALLREYYSHVPFMSKSPREIREDLHSMMDRVDHRAAVRAEHKAYPAKFKIKPGWLIEEEREAAEQAKKDRERSRSPPRLAFRSKFERE